MTNGNNDADEEVSSFFANQILGSISRLLSANNQTGILIRIIVREIVVFSFSNGYKARLLYYYSFCQCMVFIYNLSYFNILTYCYSDGKHTVYATIDNSSESDEMPNIFENIFSEHVEVKLFIVILLFKI